MSDETYGGTFAPGPSRQALAGLGAPLMTLPVWGDAHAEPPPPVLDLEEVFGSTNLADVQRRYQGGSYNNAIAHPVPELLTPDGMFNLSRAARYALAQILHDNREVIFLSPKETHRCEQFVLHLFR
ncbi:hypothetical protein J2R96_005822 [Bradyrhizobium elkanii]|nr:hypothetical protein [Bradyrhizobium elkanii]